MTPHNEAKKGEIAKTVLMPGDPLRAKMIAETYLEGYKLVNKVRNMYAYTGSYQGKPVTVMASGMGMPSIGIYSYELFKFYDVEQIIRVGSAGSYTADLDLYDTVLAEHAYSESSFAKVQNGESRHVLKSDGELNKKISEIAKKMNIDLKKGTIHSSDVFYKEKGNVKELVEKHKCLAVEMESFALFHNANVLGKKATCLLTISDSLVTGKVTTAEERQNKFLTMIELALGTI